MDTKKLNILFGPPINKERTVLSFFFSLPGKHIVSGGTTSNIVAEYLNKPLNIELVYIRKDIPPIGEMEGVDLVTEGVITMTRVKKLLAGEDAPEGDGASLIYKEMEIADEIIFVCGVLSDEKETLLTEITSLLNTQGKKTTFYALPA